MRHLSNAAEAVQWLRQRVTGTLQTDSRLVVPGDGFIAWPGAATDGRAHIASATARGATACFNPYLSQFFLIVYPNSSSNFF